MFDKWLNLPAHLYLRITALTIITVGIALSNVLMSIGTIWIISNWLLEGDFTNKWQRIRQVRSVWPIVALFLLLALSLLWSSDISYGLKDLRIKLPFIVIPLVMATSTQLARVHFRFLLYVFLGILVYTTVYNFLRYNYFLEDQKDIRDMSTFISHVRLSVLICFGICIVGFLLLKKQIQIFVGSLILLWLIFYLYKSQIINGYLLFSALMLTTVLFIIFSMRQKKWRLIWLLSTGIILVVTVIIGSNFVSKLSKPTIPTLNELELYSANNNPYYHDTTNLQTENGHFVWLYVQAEELKNGWKKRSQIPYDSLDRKGQPMFGTLMRYMTSKNLRKDSIGVELLSEEDVRRIENGQTSIALNKGIKSRIESFLLEYTIYQNGGDPNGNSILQRAEHLRAACFIINTNWLFGVGDGDVPTEFEKAYQKLGSRLNEENWHRSHNQFLTLWVSLGLMGLLLFLSLFIMPWFSVPVNYLSTVFLVGLLIACLFQDMIETQAGVTIFALFYSLALYRDFSSLEVREAIHPDQD